MNTLFPNSLEDQASERTHGPKPAQGLRNLKGPPHIRQEPVAGPSRHTQRLEGAAWYGQGIYAGYRHRAYRPCQVTPWAES